MSIREFKCPNCGGPITFSAGVQEMVCPYCESVIDVAAFLDADTAERSASEEQDINWGYRGSGWSEEEEQGLNVYSCRSCGGEIVADETLGATSCPFCGSPVVMTAKFAGALRPDYVIPFKKSKDEAVQALQKHYLGKKLLPKVFKDQNHLEEIKGVYVPFWLYDADVDANVNYKATQVRSWSDSNYNYTETSYYRVTRDGSIGFDSVPVDGASAIDDVLMQSIEPFDLKEAVPFQSAYLSGFFANKYDVDAEASADYANDRIRNSTTAAFMRTVSGYATVATEHSDIRLQTGEVRYALLPVWLLSTRWEGKAYTFAMNGQTGRFVGDLPLDKGAYWRSFFKTFALTAAILLLGSQLLVGFF